MINPVLSNAAFGAQRGATGVEREPAPRDDVAKRADDAQAQLRTSLAVGQDPGDLQEARTRFVPGVEETADAALDRLRERNDEAARVEQSRREAADAERAAGATPGAVIDEFV